MNEKWVGDITFIHRLRHDWYYIAFVIDLHTKKIVGLSLARSMTIDLSRSLYIEIDILSFPSK